MLGTGEPAPIRLRAGAAAGCQGGCPQHELDQIVQEAKNEKEVVFYAWWGEEYWKKRRAYSRKNMASTPR